MGREKGGRTPEANPHFGFQTQKANYFKWGGAIISATAMLAHSGSSK